MNIPPTVETHSTARLFFALWPPSALREAMHREALAAQQLFGGRVMRKETLHMTLLFLGDVAREHIPGLLKQVDQLHVQPFLFELNARRSWRHNRIVYLSPNERVVALEALVDGLANAASTAGVPFDRRGFTPHVTIVRKMDRPCTPKALVLPPWNVTRFALVESLPQAQGSRYSDVHQWLCR